jgi:hypothetical protein
MKNLRVSGVGIRLDENGLFCLNDLHRACGKKRRHRIDLFLRDSDTQALIEQLSREGSSAVGMGFKEVPVVIYKTDQGVFASKYLIHAYSMWVGKGFGLQVIRAFDNWMLASSTLAGRRNFMHGCFAPRIRIELHAY